MKTHQLIISKRNFQILSYDASFFYFLGGRVDKAFDRLVTENYQDQFYLNFHRFLRQVDEAAELGLTYNEYAISKEKFLLILTDEFGIENSYFCWFDVCDTEDAVALKLISVEGVISENENFQNRLEIGYAIMEAYDDTYFKYDPEKKEFQFFYVANRDQSMYSYQLEDFRTQLILGKPEMEESINEFIDNLSVGIPEQTLVLDCNIAGFEEHGQGTLIKTKGIFSEGQYKGAVGFFHSLSDLELNSYSKSEIDVLTGMYAKDEIIRQAKAMIEIRRRKGVTVGLLQIDNLEKLYADKGEDGALEVIQTVADIINREVGIDGKAGYIGDGIFMVLFTDAPNMEFMRGNLECIITGIRTHFANPETGELGLTVTAGLSAYPKDADNVKELILLDEWALNRGHNKGGNCYIIYGTKQHDSLKEIKANFAGEESIRKYFE